MILCAMFTGCSDKIASSSETDTPASSSATEPEDDAMAVDTQENAVLGAFMCGDHLIGGDEWSGFDNGYIHLEKNHVVPPSSQDVALCRYSVSGEVPL